MNESSLILDTHVWVWLIQGNEKLREGSHLQIIEKARVKSPLQISVISLWEVAMLYSKKRLDLGISLLEWFRLATKGAGISLMPLTQEIAAECALLSGLHGDPADRILVATARILGARLMTADQRIVAYGRAGNVDVLAV